MCCDDDTKEGGAKHLYTQETSDGSIEFVLALSPATVQGLRQ